MLLDAQWRNDIKKKTTFNNRNNFSYLNKQKYRKENKFFFV